MPHVSQFDLARNEAHSEERSKKKSKKKDEGKVSLMNLKAQESDVHEIQKEMVRTSDPERQLIKKRKF